eukprot:6517273-Pyramimonas_sp.AAC.1
MGAWLSPPHPNPAESNQKIEIKGCGNVQVLSKCHRWSCERLKDVKDCLSTARRRRETERSAGDR